MIDFEHPYCLVHSDGVLHGAAGEIRHHKLLSDLPEPGPLPLISMVPYAQLRERQYPVHDDGERIISLVPSRYERLDLNELTGTLAADAPVRISVPPTYDMSDEEFMRAVERIVEEEIKRGRGSNFLLSRKCRLVIDRFGPVVANTIFARLVRNEPNAYLTFCFFDGQRYFIGASPERHITIRGGVVTMNPICGTLPKAALHTRDDLFRFLTDRKEINELFQVVDEELKMMSRICSAGGHVDGPYLKEMGTLVHTEYVLEGHTDMPMVDALRESMFAATMIGSPLESAARVIHTYERDSRRYYSSALVVTGLDEAGEGCLDSAITIRTMEVGASGEAVVQSGASIVRDSVPENECREVRAKAESLLRAVSQAEPPYPPRVDLADPEVAAVLAARNEYLSRFWVERQDGARTVPAADAPSILLVDNEDEFTHMLKHVLTHLGYRATVRRYDDPELDLAEADHVLVGPGPGDPTDLGDPKMVAVHPIVRRLLASGSRFLAVCLGHQVVCHQLGMTVVAVDPPLQGVQDTIDLFGQNERVGFYNSFFALAPEHAPEGVEVAAAGDRRVMALRSPRFRTFQFHVESLLTTNCTSILRDALSWLAG